MACRIKGPAFIDIVNEYNGPRRLQLKVDGGTITLDMDRFDAAILFVVDSLEYTPAEGLVVKAVSFSGDPIEPECEG